MLNNKKIQAILIEAYNVYSLDKELDSIFDSAKEAISVDDGIITFKINKSEIEIAINYLNQVNIKGKSLEEWCNTTSWDKKS